MKTKALTKAEKQKWEPFHKVSAVKICTKNIKGEKVIVSNANSARLVIE